MPLLKIFSRKALTGVSTEILHHQLAFMWNVPHDVLKVLILPVHDMSCMLPFGAPADDDDEKDKDIYVDIRAEAKPERTQDVIDTAMTQTQILLQEYGYKATIRVELYEPSLQSSLSPTY